MREVISVEWLMQQAAFHRKLMTTTIAGENEHNAAERNAHYRATQERFAEVYEELVARRLGDAK